ADNNGISVGDTMEIGGKKLMVTGLVALSDYSCLFSDNNDSMFDASMFGVAVMTEEGWKTFPSGHVEYGYSWIYNTKPRDDREEKDASETLMKKLNNISPLEDFVPQYVNQAIQFTGDDMGGDRS
ncbi:MAG: ABC transporter permease, partial [Eubacteriales bacterium]|nr:ABC transporter permease [Eubacteriales bacterium]